MIDSDELTPAMDTIGEQVRIALGDAYVVERELTGGMSCVFVAMDRALERRVVVKVMHPELAASVSVERFRREILTVAALQHANIVGVLHAGEVNGLPFFVMPYVEGESLATRLERGPLSVRETVAIMKDVTRALAFAHARGIVHRDIKPGNILLAGGAAVVTDFGVAKALTSSRRTGPGPSRGLTTVGVSLGTLLYMAPEQAAADPDIDGRADIYSLGITAYEMLAGSPPFAELPARAMMAARFSGAVPPLGTRRADVPPGVQEVIRRCVAADPADRFPTAERLLQMLEDPELLRVAPATPVRHRRRAVVLGVAGGALLSAAVLGVGMMRGRTAVNDRAPSAAATPAVTAAHPPGTSIAVVPFVDLGTNAADARFAAGITDAVAGNLTQSGRVRVVAPSVAAAYVHPAWGADSLRRRLGAQYLLEGTVQREGRRIRVTARLSNVSDGVMRWANVFERDSGDVFAVQDQIAAAIAAAVETPSS